MTEEKPTELLGRGEFKVLSGGIIVSFLRWNLTGKLKRQDREAAEYRYLEYPVLYCRYYQERD